MKRISYIFAFGKSVTLSPEVAGPVVVSADRLYLVPVRSSREAGESGGALGRLLASPINRAHDKVWKRREGQFEAVLFEQLDPQVQLLAVWGKEVTPESRVVTVAKDAVRSIRCSMLSGIRIETPDGQLIIKIGPWGVRKARRVFDELGWTYT